MPDRRIIHRKPLEELTLLDRFLFDTAMSKPEVARNILSIILDSELTEIHIGVSEKTEEPFYDSRSVRLDLLAFDTDETVYDAEAQKKNIGYREMCRRFRLYQSITDASLLIQGDLFSDLNDIYVIFLSPFDLFGKGKYRYTFRMVCDEVPGLIMDDGATRIFLNTRGTNDSDISAELAEFLHIAENTFTGDDSPVPESPRVKLLVDQIRRIKHDQEVGVRYMRFLEELELEKAEARQEARAEGREEGWAEGRAEGRAEGALDILITLVKDGIISVKDAAERAGITESVFQQKMNAK